MAFATVPSGTALIQPTRPNLSRILRKAWMCAKLAAHRFGGSARIYLAEAMRQAWQCERDLVQRCNQMEARVRAEVAAIIAMPRPTRVPVRPSRGFGRSYQSFAA